MSHSDPGGYSVQLKKSGGEIARVGAATALPPLQEETNHNSEKRKKRKTHYHKELQSRNLVQSTEGVVHCRMKMFGAPAF